MIEICCATKFSHFFFTQFMQLEVPGCLTGCINFRLHIFQSTTIIAIAKLTQRRCHVNQKYEADAIVSLDLQQSRVSPLRSAPGAILPIKACFQADTRIWKSDSAPSDPPHVSSSLHCQAALALLSNIDFRQK